MGRGPRRLRLQRWLDVSAPVRFFGCLARQKIRLRAQQAQPLPLEAALKSQLIGFVQHQAMQ